MGLINVGTETCDKDKEREVHAALPVISQLNERNRLGHLCLS